jgi:hypothetical protein
MMFNILVGVYFVEQDVVMAGALMTALQALPALLIFILPGG